MFVTSDPTARLRSVAAIALIGAVVSSVSPLWAQDSAPPAKPPILGRSATGPLTIGDRYRPQSRDEVATPARPPAKPAKIDETALRYYAGLNDTARVAAEIARIRQKYPDWVPPDDLEFGTVAADERDLWDLFAQGRYDELTARITESQNDGEGHRPSKDLVNKLDQALARRDIARAAERSDWDGVLQIASGHEPMLVCAEMDVLWNVGRAAAGLGDTAQALAVYRYILSTCTDPAERLATVQKASELLPADLSGQLIAMGKRRPDGTGEFDRVRLDATRRVIGAAAAGRSNERPDERDLQRLEAEARSRSGRDDAMLLGWYAFAAKKPADALDWFRTADAVKSDPKSIEGQALALRELKRIDEALALARADADKSPELRRIFVELVAAAITGEAADRVDAGVIAQAGDIVAADRNAVAAQSIGWYRLNHGAAQEARTWFQRSLDFAPSAEAATGLALAADRLGDRKAARGVYETYAGRFPMVAALSWLSEERAAAGTRARRGHSGAGVGRGVSQEERDAVALHEAGRYREAAAALEQIDRRKGASYDRDVVLAWAYFNTAQYGRAKEMFARLDRIRSTRDTRYGATVSDARDRGMLGIW
jgi:tetratricopeptide (TPR) repeat protein